jgi:pyridinium-3,5-bisthiocarboxylic acid mononucleotide nickel chelatase
MRAVYFDCWAGVSGDMIVGAQIDLGVDPEALKAQLASLQLEGYKINVSSVRRGGIAATKFDVVVDQEAQPHRHLSDINTIIVDSGLSETVKSQAQRIFERLADAEASVHGTTPEKIHFHEVGAVDSIIDTVSSLIGFELLDVDKFLCSPLRVGSGTVSTEHGILPVPAPATAELLRGIPVYAGEIPGEFVTPTGAVIVATLCEEFVAMPPMKIDRIGYGAGSRDPEGFANALRLIVGEPANEARIDLIESSNRDEPAVIVETNIDDMNPQVYGFVMERAFELGALDVFMTPVQMKKQRPGVLLTLLCRPETVDAAIEMLLAETTTLGVRYYETNRRVLERLVKNVVTPFGQIRVKVARCNGHTLHFQPEYDDCANAATSASVAFSTVHRAAVEAYEKSVSTDGESAG